MRTMDLSSAAFRLTKRKMIVTLLPIIFPLLQSLVELDLLLDFLPLEVDLILEIPIVFFALVESVISQPFAPILRQLGWWSSNGIFVGPDGPLLPGSFAVAITYSLLIYLVWSLISAWRQTRRRSF